jgi:undecaprenyl diphosphate synthase
MDGNGRWAAAKGLPRLEGHRRGAERLIEIVDACIDAGVNTLTVFAFSAENWKRPLEEVSGLFKLGEWILRAHLARLEERDVRLHAIGDIAALPDFVRAPLQDVIKFEQGQHRVQPRGRAELRGPPGDRRRRPFPRRGRRRRQAAARCGRLGRRRSPAADRRPARSGSHHPHLQGEFRLSNFLLLQLRLRRESSSLRSSGLASTRPSSSSPFAEYAKRERRFGMTGAQVQTPAQT